MKNSSLVVRSDASESVLSVLIWAVLSVLSTRVFLLVADNPTIGRGQWHIAHVLFGGIIMTGATLSLLVFSGTHLRKNMSCLFGVGWGLFVDEVGKYITRDNDYWFRPAPMIIYISFVILFLTFRYLKRIQSRNSKTIFYSVLSQLEELVENDLEVSEKKKLKIDLQKVIDSGDHNTQTVAAGLLVSINQIRAIGDKKASTINLFTQRMFSLTYNRFFKRKLVLYSLLVYSIYYSIDKIFDALRISFSPQKMMMLERFYRDYDFFGKSDIYLIVFKILFDLAASVMFLLGVRYFWTNKRLKGLRFFKYGLYISILLGSVFKFYFEQMSAFIDVLINILLLEILNQYRKDLLNDKHN